MIWSRGHLRQIWRRDIRLKCQIKGSNKHLTQETWKKRMDTSFITLVSCHLIGLFYNMTQKDIVQWWGTSETYLWNVVTLPSFCDCDSFSNVLMLYINILLLYNIQYIRHFQIKWSYIVTVMHKWAVFKMLHVKMSCISVNVVSACYTVLASTSFRCHGARTWKTC